MMTSLVWLVSAVAVTASLEEKPCHTYVSSAAKALRSSARDALQLAQTILTANPRDSESASDISDAAREASWIVDRVADDLYLISVISCPKDADKARAYVAGVIPISSESLGMLAEETVIASAQTQNASLANLAATIRERIRAAASLVRKCSPAPE